MPNQPLSTIGLVMPGDFAVVPYEAIHSRVVAKKEAYRHSWAQYASAWNALAYRFLSCATHDREFTQSIKRAGSSPPQPERYIQERALFSFFVTGLAAIESLCYGLFAIGSMLNAQNFSITTPQDMRLITPRKTARQFAAAFPKEHIAAALQQMRNAQDFRDWKEIRNILAHRSAPGRLFHEGGPHHGETLWVKGIQIDENTMASRRQWLAKTVRTLLIAADVFTIRQLSS